MNYLSLHPMPLSTKFKNALVVFGVSMNVQSPDAQCDKKSVSTFRKFYDKLNLT